MSRTGARLALSYIVAIGHAVRADIRRMLRPAAEPRERLNILNIRATARG